MARYTLRKYEILRRRKEIMWAFKNSKTVFSSEYVVLRYAAGNQRKVLFAVERGVKRAVKRNRIKRKLREWYRLNKENLPSGIWILIGKRQLAKLKGPLPLNTDALDQSS